MSNENQEGRHTFKPTTIKQPINPSSHIFKRNNISSNPKGITFKLKEKKNEPAIDPWQLQGDLNDSDGPTDLYTHF